MRSRCSRTRVGAARRAHETSRPSRESARTRRTSVQSRQRWHSAARICRRSWWRRAARASPEAEERAPSLYAGADAPRVCDSPAPWLPVAPACFASLLSVHTQSDLAVCNSHGYWQLNGRTVAAFGHRPAASQPWFYVALRSVLRHVLSHGVGLFAGSARCAHPTRSHRRLRPCARAKRRVRRQAFAPRCCREDRHHKSVAAVSAGAPCRRCPRDSQAGPRTIAGGFSQSRFKLSRSSS